ncbi:hypothetical protein ABPG75_002272 [Micractinium tetrahymenae]
MPARAQRLWLLSLLLLAAAAAGLSPKLEVTQGDILELTLINDIPPSVPNVAGGISIHFHGFNMRGAPWFDGVAYIETCPVAPGASFKYRFQVNEMPGTYFWHGHTGADRGDGLAGLVIVHPRKGDTLPVAVQYDEERTLFLSDWWHTSSAALAMPLNRPFDSARQTNDTGGFAWVNDPQSLLINSRGCYLDCALGPGGSKDPVNCSIPAANYWIGPGRSAQQTWASAVNPGCAHENVTVEAGKTYLFRIINSASLPYQTVCFEGHDVTIVAADAVPVKPIAASKFKGCIDINSGQRYDVLLTANKAAGNYWIATSVQFRPGSPSGYAVLRYKGAAEALPTTPLPQPGSVTPWTVEQEAQIVMNSQLKNYTNKGVAGGVFREAISQACPLARLPACRSVGWLAVLRPCTLQTAEPCNARWRWCPINPHLLQVPNATVSLLLNITQPLMEQTGQIRWALNNVAGQVRAGAVCVQARGLCRCWGRAPPGTELCARCLPLPAQLASSFQGRGSQPTMPLQRLSPRLPQNPAPCKPLLDLVYDDPRWVQKNVVPSKDYLQSGFNSSALGTQLTHDGKGKVDVFLTTPGKANPPPVYPTAGTHLIPLKKGEVADMVLQNLNANANNGDYRGEAGTNRTAQEQHPFHLHGHHFWLLGSGLGVYDPVANASSLNTANPPLRDTATLPQGGWVVLRFRADNPGYMGQMLMLAEALDDLPRRPAGLPRCPSTCFSNAAPWKHSYVRKEWGSTGYEIP